VPARYGIGAILVVAGFLLGLGYRYLADATIDPTITIGQLVQSLVTLLLALIVSKWWRDAHFRTDKAKDLLIDGLKRVREQGRALEDATIALCDSGWTNARYRDVIRLNRALSNTITEIDTTARGVFNATPCRALRAAALDIKRATTSGGPHQQPNRVGVDRSFARFSVEIGSTQTQFLHL
jgi:hypothetical protein